MFRNLRLNVEQFRNFRFKVEEFAKLGVFVRRDEGEQVRSFAHMSETVAYTGCRVSSAVSTLPPHDPPR